MGRLSLAIGRQKDNGDGRSKSKHFRTSLKGLLRLPNSEERASIDLGNIREHANEDSTPRHSVSATQSTSSNSAMGNSTQDGPDAAPARSDAESEGRAAFAKVIKASSSRKQDLQAGKPIAADKQTPHTEDGSKAHLDAATAALAPESLADGQVRDTTEAGAGDVHAEQAAALARYSIVSDKPGIEWDAENEEAEKHGWRRRGSLLSSRLAAPLRKDSGGGGRILIRKESTPLFSSSAHRNHHLFHRSGASESSSGGSGLRSSFWRSSSSSNNNASSNSSAGGACRTTGTDQHPSQTAPQRMVEARAERTHRSSSVPFFTPVLSTGSARPAASPYLRAIGTGVAGNGIGSSSSSGSGSGGRLNRNELRMSLANSRQQLDRFPKLSMMGGGSDGGSPAGLPSPAAQSNDGTGVSAATPMTFLVSPRPRASTTSRHALSRVATGSQEFRPGKRTLSSATIPALELNVPASPRALTGAVDMSEFGVSSSNSGAASTANKSPILPPSPISTGTPARSVASARFEPVHDSVESKCTVAEKEEDEAAEELSEDSQSSDAVHETHRMQVVHDPYTGRKMINQYMIIRELGRGTHGKVKLVFDTVTGDYFAIKIIDKESRDRRLRLGANIRTHGNVRIDMDKMEKVKREIAILKKCRHPNVVRLREVIDDAHARRIYLVIEYMDGGEIKWRDDDGLPAMDASEARSVFRDLVLGVEYLHYAGVLHRDLKPQNLLCNKAGRVKISDFGVSFLSRRQEKPRKPRHANTAIIISDGKAPSPLRPAGKAAALQGTSLHRYASQPLMGSARVLQRQQSVLRRQASVLSKNASATTSRSSRQATGSVSSADGSFSSSAASQNRRRIVDDQLLRQPGRSPHNDTPVGMGMVDEFGNNNTDFQPRSAPISPSPAISPVFKLPPESLSADSNVYDPFDSSDSNEFFSSDSESDYGSINGPEDDAYAGELNKEAGLGGLGRSRNDDDDSDDEEDDDAGGIVFGAVSVGLTEPAPSATTRSRHVRKGTLGDIDFTYDEKDEERELAKTAGTPAFFAPELCCTVEELAKVLKDERARRRAHARLVSRHRCRHNTDPVSSHVPQLDCEAEEGASSVSRSESASASGSGSGVVRPSSLQVEPNQKPRLAKRHSAIVSLLARPFSPKSRLTSASSASSSSIQSSVAPLPEEEEDADIDEPLPPKVITPAIDIWAMGVTLYCLVFGRVPFRASNEFELFNVIPRRALEFPQVLEGTSESDAVRKLPPLDPDLLDLLTRLLDKDFRSRITIEEIKQHPWVIRDLDRPSSWAQETDPAQRPSLNVTSLEVAQAVVPKQRVQKGFRASFRRRISQMQSTATKTKSSLDWLKIW
ncbi:hypothetical protein FB645_000613 [Coemansia sp. IMI 203386]|nr:hypothetical protein FB645_000613 [Coemansia sp. IMI 203386]